MRLIKPAFALLFLLSANPLLRADVPEQAHTTVMPMVDVSNQPLDKVLDQVRGKLPWFHYVVFRSPNAPADFPKLPVMSVDGVTIEQFLNLVKDQYPTVKVTAIAGDKSPLYSIRIEDPNSASTSSPGDQSPAARLQHQREAESNVKLDYARADLASKEVELKRKQQLFNTGAASSTEVEQAELAVKLDQAQVKLAMLEHDRAIEPPEPTPVAAAANEKPIVKVYRLDDILANFKTEIEKKGMDDVLSLVQAALEAEAGSPATLKLHPPTQTLVFKGSAAQVSLLEEVLDSLRPRQSEEVAAVRRELDSCRAALDRSDEALHETMSNLKSANQDRQTLQMDLMTRRAEIEMLQKQLAVADATHRLAHEASTTEVAKLLSTNITDTQKQLDEAKAAGLGASNPKVVQLQHQLDSLNEKLKELSTTQPSK